MADHTHNIILCRCSDTGVVPQTTIEAVIKHLITSETPFIELSDLCAATTSDTLIKEINNSEEVTIIACYPRAVKWLLHKSGLALDEIITTCLNMRESTAEEIINSISDTVTSSGPANTIKNSDDSWMPWFPVIDYDRCTSCKQCHSFCLFGVYEITDDNKVNVIAPANCKTHCPACARICPEAAIMFPKIDEAPINGAEITDENTLKSQIKVNVDEILGDNIYDALAKRRAEAKKRLFCKQAIEQAEEERNACSVNCKKECQKKQEPNI